jgi:hypothetical protein
VSDHLQTCHIGINSVVGIATLCVATYRDVMTVINANNNVQI